MVFTSTPKSFLHVLKKNSEPMARSCATPPSLFLFCVCCCCVKRCVQLQGNFSGSRVHRSYSVRIGFAHRIVAHSLCASVPQCVQLPALVSTLCLRGSSSSLYAQLSLPTLDLPHTVGVNLACELAQSRREDFLERCDQRLLLCILHA